MVGLIAIAVGLFYATRSSDNGEVISARVLEVMNHPNIAEDGYRGYTVQTDSGRTYTINATAFINTPASPDDLGQSCVTIPALKEGQRIEFSLPKSKDDTFVTCYKKGSGSYFLREQN